MGDKEQNRMQHYGMSFDTELYLDLADIDDVFEQRHERIQTVAQRQIEKLERELVLAFHRGYDGADEFVGHGDRPPGTDFKVRTVVHPWTEGNEPDRPSWASQHRRYDFRGVTYQDLHEAHEEIDNG